jgi:nucleotide-binding universal stress UspA family protein
MLQVDCILCLVSPTAGTSAALRQAAHLAAAGEAVHARAPTVHVAPRTPGTGSARRDAIHEQIGQLPAPIDVEVHDPLSDGEETFGSALQDVVANVDPSLLVFDAPDAREPVPPLAEADTRALVEQLDCPLFAAQAVPDPASIRHILVPTDLSDRSVETVQHATELARIYGAQVTLLHVNNTSPYVALTPVDRLSLGTTTLSEHRARHRLEKFVRRGRPADVSVRTCLAFGEPAGRVIQFVREQNVDVLVLGSQGTGARAGRPLGHVADRILRRLTCPVFLVRTFGRSMLVPPSTAGEEGETNE